MNTVDILFDIIDKLHDELWDSRSGYPDNTEYYLAYNYGLETARDIILNKIEELGGLKNV